MTVEEMYASLKSMLADVVPDVELRYKAEIAVQINQLKLEKNAVILGHNYMEPVLFYSIPDFKGDSLDLSRKAATTDKDVIVFCGVKFMAETAKILNPTKKVLLPATKAGCSLAESITAEDVRTREGDEPGGVGKVVLGPLVAHLFWHEEQEAARRMGHYGWRHRQNRRMPFWRWRGCSRSRQTALFVVRAAPNPATLPSL